MSFRSPQDVEVVVDGAWVPGAMLGWRVDATGGCQALVRLRGAHGQEAWTDLAAVRLPERHLSLAPAPAGAPGTVVTAAVGHPAVTPGVRAPRRARRHGGDVTAEQPAVRPGAAGRHRAPAGSGRHRAATAEMPVVTCAAPAAAVTADGVADLAAGATVDTASEPDLLTRPIRLGDLVPHPRGGRPAVRPPA
ncbi:hypothetical protein JD79_02534 [Geodermatophilus normandii]|uniref:Uncharacterized protein n=1 Tax=Geodermatophilus normandii TaxID=1137989 RepID=A0A317QP22_9ACTN|nr:hypothetical protein JD79_02534 [Geodermatophilus normandii]